MRILKLLAVALLCSLPALGQGIYINLPPITNSMGQPIAGATVAVFQASGNAGALVAGTPVTVYSNVGLSTPIATLLTDGFGNFPFYINPSSNPYCYTVTGQGTNTSLCYGFSAQIAPLSSPTFTSPTITGNATVAKMNNVVWVDGTTYTTIAAAYAAITTGVVMVPPNYTETLAANLTLKRNAGIHFMGPATITMGTFQVIVPQGEDGAFITTERADGFNGNSTGVRFLFSGSANAFQVGTTLGNTRDIYFSGFKITLSASNSTGIFLSSVQQSHLERLGVDGGNLTGQVGIICDGTFNFCGDNLFLRPAIAAVQTGLQFQNNGNANVVVGMSFQGQGGTPTGINFGGGNGNVVIGADLEQLATGVNFTNASNNFGNRVSMYGQGNTNDFVCGAASTGNVLDNIGATNAAQVTTSGCVNNNVVVNPFKLSVSAGSGITNGLAIINGLLQINSATFGSLAFDASANVLGRIGAVIGWTSFAGDPANGTNDTGLSRVQAGVIAAGNGTAKDSSALFMASGNKTVLTADWTCGTAGTVASCAAATIIGSGGGVPMTFTLPLVAASYQLDCDFIVGQSGAATSNQWNLLTATNGATNVTALYDMYTAAAVKAAGAVTDQASTTSTFQISPNWTLGGTGTKMPVRIHAAIEGASASGTVLSVQLLAPTAADVVTIYRGSECHLY